MTGTEGTPTVSLQPFAASQLPLLEVWLHALHVAPWFPRPENVLAFAAAPPDGSGQALIAADGDPVGYLRWTRVDRETLDELDLAEIAEGSADVDILIGETGATARGIGPQALEQLAQRLARQGVPTLGLTSSPDNRRAHRAFVRAGFEHTRDYVDPGQGRAFLFTRELARACAPER